jgi:hypothetical protein
MHARGLAWVLAAGAVAVGATARAEAIGDGPEATPRTTDVIADPAPWMAGADGRVVTDDLGVVSGSGPTGWMNGASVALTSRSNRIGAGVLTQLLSAPTTDRLQGLGEFGLFQPIGSRWNGFALALAGVDFLYHADHWAAPAAGARVGVEWNPTWRSVFASFGLSLTAVGDLTAAHDEAGRAVTGFTAVFALSGSLVLSHAKRP